MAIAAWGIDNMEHIACWWEWDMADSEVPVVVHETGRGFWGTAEAIEYLDELEEIHVEPMER